MDGCGGGIPSVITSDKGPQFVGGWFRGMCAQLGIRQAFSQAYRSQANGRAERAGRQIMEWLRKLNAEKEINWVEALPKVLKQYHDAVGESGYSPYEIVFGRFRNLPGIPQPPEKACEDARDFLERQVEVDKQVARVLNHKHELAADRLNRNRPERRPFKVGDQVWVYRPKRVGGYKIEPKWWGPVEVEARVGANSYVVAWEGATMEVPIDDLKPYDSEVLEGEPTDMWFMERNVEEEEVDPDQSVVERICGHRRREDGTLEFEVKWAGWGTQHNTWEPVVNFTKCCKSWVDYCVDKNLQVPSAELGS